MRTDFGKQERENGWVSNLSVVVALPPVAAGAPAFLGVKSSRLNFTVTPESNKYKTLKGPMDKAFEAYEKAVESSNWNWCDSACVAVIILGSSYYLYHFAKWAHLGFRVIGK
jgi:hypothetical protein